MTALRAAKTRRIVFVILLAMLLVTAATAGNVWHHHATATAESTCPICHWAHLTAHQPAVTQSDPSFLVARSETPLFEPLFTEGSMISRLATRAPPSL
jgi:hypothetical protein